MQYFLPFSGEGSAPETVDKEQAVCSLRAIACMHAECNTLRAQSQSAFSTDAILRKIAAAITYTNCRICRLKSGHRHIYRGRVD